MRTNLRIRKEERLEKAKDILIERLKHCDLCPRNCGANRLRDEKGFCKTGRFAKLSSVYCHFGEEKELVGSGGSGTVFFSYCNMSCIYCQNYTISQLGEGRVVPAEELSDMMIKLQDAGAENINFVTPTHVIAQIVEAVYIAVKRGLHLPLVYNCGGYEDSGVLRLLDGIFDIYMPDIKYSDNRLAYTLSGVPGYWETCQDAVKEMYKQVGNLTVEGRAAKRGLLIRHLVLPGFYKDAFKIIDFIKDELSVDTYVNIMDQYKPYYRADKVNQLHRGITENEYKKVIGYARAKGLYRGLS